MAESEKLVFMVTHGPAEPELATIPFVMAAAALASDVAVVMGFQGNGVQLVAAGAADGVQAPEFPPLAKLLADVRDLGGLLLVCNPCIRSRGIAVFLLAAEDGQLVFI
jgi:predicted peroxiredoxin